MTEEKAARCRRMRFAWVLLMSVFPGGLFAQSVSIEAGARWQVGDAVVDLDCAILDVGGALDAQAGQVAGIGHLELAGQLTAGTAAIEVGGNWNNHGGFTPGAGTVLFGDRCDAGAASISGTTTFSTLRIESARAKTYRFEAGRTQSVASTLRLAGTAGQYLSIGSTQAGVRAGLALSRGGAQQIAWVSVADMEAPEDSAWLAPDRPEAFNAIDSGNNLRWFQPQAPVALPVPVPTASGWAWLALALALGTVGRRALRAR